MEAWKFLNENHDYRIWGEKYKDFLLNPDVVVCRYADVQPQMEDFFIRPCEDNKDFSGKVMHWEEFSEWRNKVLSVGCYSNLNADTTVMYGPVKEIFTETRFFVVNNKIVGKSIYKRGKKVIYDSCVDQPIIDFCNKMIELWTPAQAFVLDIAHTPDGYKVIEVNGINSAGFYEIDMYSLVDAIERIYD